MADDVNKDLEPLKPWQNTLHEIIFEADTPGGKAFDVALLILICLSVLAVVLDSVDGIGENGAFHTTFVTMEWIFTILFTIEYVLRLLCVRRKLRYAVSFYGIIDLLAILPTYLSLIFLHAESLALIRAFRLLRIFRIFKLAHFLRGGRELAFAIKSSRSKIVVFLTTVLIIAVTMGALMYFLEDEHNPEAFGSIPQATYWAIVTLTTVGYGDATPVTVLGKFAASILMILGYAMIIVPMGIVSSELAQLYNKQLTTQACPSCHRHGHDADAEYCKYCGAAL